MMSHYTFANIRLFWNIFLHRYFSSQIVEHVSYSNKSLNVVYIVVTQIGFPRPSAKPDRDTISQILVS